MTELPSADKTLTEMLKAITHNIDHDLATVVSSVINLYTAALQRKGRTILGPDDASRILLIIHHIMLACEGEPDPELIPGAPVGKEPAR